MKGHQGIEAGRHPPSSEPSDARGQLERDSRPIHQLSRSGGVGTLTTLTTSRSPPHFGQLEPHFHTPRRIGSSSGPAMSTRVSQPARAHFSRSRSVRRGEGFKMSSTGHYLQPQPFPERMVIRPRNFAARLALTSRAMAREAARGLSGFIRRVRTHFVPGITSPPRV